MPGKIAILLFLIVQSVFAKPPNDDFSDAIQLKGQFPIRLEGSLTDRLDRFRATKEDHEPNYAGQEEKGSVWYTWAPNKNEHVRLRARSLKKYINLPADVPVNLSLSLHNNNERSTDMGLDIRIYSIA
jgi:hypothetical protein